MKSTLDDALSALRSAYQQVANLAITDHGVDVTDHLTLLQHVWHALGDKAQAEATARRAEVVTVYYQIDHPGFTDHESQHVACYFGEHIYHVASRFRFHDNVRCMPGHELDRVFQLRYIMDVDGTVYDADQAALIPHPEQVGQMEAFAGESWQIEPDK